MEARIGIGIGFGFGFGLGFGLGLGLGYGIWRWRHSEVLYRVNDVRCECSAPPQKRLTPLTRRESANLPARQRKPSKRDTLD